ncbi:predicted metal-dependent hydrolase with the TIM-barrel fold [Longilinea arvoryzae]|uniref:Predicted metal-dependent hydrolase with the TIM-barrel fold n=1 Tax=Longilinea arvoryzae TaxID=360412 RepID=A0A0S7BCU3_9CHLR|nr:hypothetical protein [Longilinea arvoryzae]GAP13149.1 predicted metal-dependent hydrolase with the TIM-barrel fold [Longilinea arvoryzae]
MNPQAVPPAETPDRRIMTVCGPLIIPGRGIVEAHNHAWIESVPGTGSGFVLNQLAPILAELQDYARAGGIGIVDCQPGGCGRNGLRLRDLMAQSGVFIVAATGYHLPKYYPPAAPIWGMDEEQAYHYFGGELQTGLTETLRLPQPVRAGFIKIACQESLEQTPPALLRAAAAVCRDLDCAVEVHTEKGAAMAEIADFFVRQGADLGRLVLCHVDKRPDFGLHRELARAGVLLEYDTFYRPKYRPEANVWPLIGKMLSAGLAGQVALATDMAESTSWKSMGGEPGLAALPQDAPAHLQAMGAQPAEIAALMGLNITGRIARPVG